MPKPKPFSTKLSNYAASLMSNLAEKINASRLPNPDRYEEELFSYTSGRWVYNEQKHLEEHYVSFNVSALQFIATKAVGADRCTSMVKIAEGASNKVFLMTFSNSARVIARLPCIGISGPAHLTTASEVATMDFARNVLGLPVPRVIHYSSRAKGTPVGSEFILMDVVEDMEFHALARRSDTALNELGKTVRDTAEMLRTLCRTPFSQIGSLFYKEDVSLDLQNRPLYAADAPPGLAGADRFRIGPSVGSEFWKGNREHLLVDRGPWRDMASYAIAAARCQQMWLKVYATPRVLIGPVGNTIVQETSAAHCALLDHFIHIIPYLIPKDDRLLRSILWHPDLNGSNIFVNDSTFGSRGSVVAFIDWQGSTCAPLVLQARHPPAMEHVGSIDDLPVHAAPAPDAYVDPETIGTSRRVRKAALHRMFEERTRENELYRLSVSFVYREYLVPLMYCVSGTWSDGYAWFRENLHRAEEALRMHDPNYIPLPVVPRSQLAAHQAQYQATLLRHHHFELIQDSLGLVGEGWVGHEKYDAVMKKLPGHRKDWDEGRLGPWPFQDGAWSVED